MSAGETSIVLNISNLQNTNRSTLIIFCCFKDADKWKPVNQQDLERVGKLLFSHNCMEITSCYSIFSILVLLFFSFLYSKLFVKLSCKKPRKYRYFSSQEEFPRLLSSLSFFKRVVTKIFPALYTLIASLLLLQVMVT